MQTPSRTSQTRLLQPEILQLWLERHQETTASFRELTHNFSPAQLAWKPAPKSWSILECMDHLCTTANLYHPKIKAAIQHRTENNLQNEDGFEPSWFARKFVGYLAPDSAMKIPAPAVFSPKSLPADMEIVTRFFAVGHEFSDFIHKSHDLDLNGKKFHSPITSFVRFTLGEGLWLNVTHQDRHLQQAKRISTVAEFPSF